MVQVDIPGLPKDLNVNYRPPRVSLFPPSYRDRAYLRSVHRQVLRQTEDLRKKASEEESTGKAPASKKNTETASKSSQTAESYCYHVCSVHPTKGKKGEGNKNPGMKDAGTNTGKQGQQKKKGGQKGGTDGSDDDSDNPDEPNDWQRGQNKANKNKGTQTGQQKGYKQVKWEDDEASTRPFLPYPLSSPYAESFWNRNTYQKPYSKKPFSNTDEFPGWNLDHKLEAARRADEKYMWNWLAQHEGNYQQSAFQWLAERDSQRQAKLAQASYDLAGLSLDPMSDRTPLAFPLRSGYSHFRPGPADIGGYLKPNGHRQECFCPQCTGYSYDTFNRHVPPSYPIPTMHNHHQNFPHPGQSGNSPPPHNMQHGRHSTHPAHQPCNVCSQWHQSNHRTTSGPAQHNAGHMGLDGQSKNGDVFSPRISHNATSNMPDQHQSQHQHQQNDASNTFLTDQGIQQHAPAKETNPIMKNHPFFADDPPQDSHHNDHVMSGAIQPFSTGWGKETW